MNNLFYVLIARDELVNIIKTGNIILPLLSRFVSPFDANVDVIKKQFSAKLEALNVNTSEDYVLSLIEVQNIHVEAELNVSIFDFKKLYCLDNLSLSAYSRIFSQLCFNIIEFDIGIEEVIENINKKRLFKILEDEMGVSITSPVKELSKQVENYLVKNEKMKTLFNYKREVSLVEGNKSLLNDTVTLAMINSVKDLAKSDILFNKYIAGINIAGAYVDKFIEENEVLRDMDSINFVTFIQTIINIIQYEEENEVPFITRLNETDLNGKFNYLVFGLIYLKLKITFKESEEFNALLNLYNKLNSIALDELNIAYILFFSKLEYSDLYTSYYEYKKLDLFNDYLIPQSDSDREIENLNSSLSKKGDEIAALLKDKSTSEERLICVTSELEETKSILKQTIDESSEYKDNTSPISVEASNTIPDNPGFQELFFEIFSEDDIKVLSKDTALKLCKEFYLLKGDEKNKPHFIANLLKCRESSVPIDSPINESFSLE